MENLKERYSLKLFLVFAVVRGILAVAQRTHMHADEHWQGPEVAHRLVFGSPYKTWEWLDDVALRSHFHPFIFAIFFKIISILHLDTPWLVAYGPRLVQAIIAAAGDTCFYRIAQKLYGSQAASIVTACHMTSWYSVYSHCRTTGNAMEMSLTLIGLWFQLSDRPVITAIVAAACFIMRPPSAIFWLPICIAIAFRYPLRRTLQCLAAAVSLILFSMLTDRLFYGTSSGWFVPWNFFKFNVLDGISRQYGEEPWDMHIRFFRETYGVYLLAVPFGLLKFPGSWKVAMTVIFVAMSLAAHKEHRFLMPFLAVAFLGCAPALLRVSGLKLLYAACIVQHAFIGVWMSRWDWAGAEVVMEKLRQVTSDGDKVFFLTRAHATPFYQYMHKTGVTLDFPDGSPWPVRKTEISDSDTFMAEPAAWIRGPGRDKLAEAKWVVFEARDQVDPNKVPGAFEELRLQDFSPLGGPVFDVYHIFEWIPFRGAGPFYYKLFERNIKHSF